MGKWKDISFRFSAALDLFKHRISRAIYKSSIRLVIERPFYACQVREIPNLWKLL
jgi:hypothetical protein